MSQKEDELVPVGVGQLRQPRSGRPRPGRAAFRRWRSAALLGGALGAIAVGWNLRPARLETSGHTEPMESVDPQGAELRQQVSRCRSLAAAEDGSEPDWGKAASACERALDLDPIDREANLLHAKVALERQASEDYSAARRALEQFKPED